MKFLLFVVVVIAAIPDVARSQQNVNVRLQAILLDNDIQYSETSDAFHTALDRAYREERCACQTVTMTWLSRS